MLNAEFCVLNSAFWVPPLKTKFSEQFKIILANPGTFQETLRHRTWYRGQYCEGSDFTPLFIMVKELAKRSRT